MKSALASAMILLCVITINAQTSIGNSKRPLKTQVYKEIKIGNKLPNITINNILNYKTSTESFNGFGKNQFVIIDFFATWCAPCVKALPKLDSFQKKYPGEFKVLVVTRQSKATIQKFLESRNLKTLALPFACEDTVLGSLFPHKVVPHEVWVDNKQVVKAITSAIELNEKNVKAFTNGKLEGLAVKKDDLAFDLSKPLFKDGNGGDGSEFLGRTILTKYTDGLPGGNRIDLQPGDKIRRFVAANSVLLHLYYTAYSSFELPTANFKRIIFETRDSASVKRPYNKELPSETRASEMPLYSYCYEFMLPEAVPRKEFFKFMLEDLNHYFNTYAVVEKRLVPCWTLVRINNGDKRLETIGGEVAGAFTGKISNLPVSYLVRYLNTFYQVEPIIDETGFTKNIDMILDFDRNINKYPDIIGIRKVLQLYGLDLVKTERELDVLVIKDKLIQ